MSAIASHDLLVHRILTAIESGRPLTQRALSRELGVALGLTNLLIRRLAKKGFVKVAGLRTRQVKYLITPAGVAEKTRVSRLYLENTLHLYTETRERIRQRLQLLSCEWGDDAPDGEKRIVFYAAGEVAEIAYISLQNTDLRLIGVIDDQADKRFFGLPVVPLANVQPDSFCGEPFGRIVVTSVRHAERLGAKLRQRGIADRLVFTL